MKLSKIRLTGRVIALLLATIAAASLGERNAGAQEAPPAEAGAADKTGTNPLNLQQSAIIFNEYQNLPNGGKYANFLNFRYLAPPFAIGKGPAQVRLTLPIAWADRGGGSDFGIGDFNRLYGAQMPILDGSYRLPAVTAFRSHR